MAFWNREKKDITPETDNRKKRAIVRYFEMLYNKGTKLVSLNLAYFACILPMVCGILYFICIAFGISGETINQILFLNIAVWLVENISPAVVITLFTVSVIVYGPLTAGLSFCARNIATERHIYISDIFSRAKENWKQGLILGIIDIVVLVSVILYLSADFSMITGTMAIFYKVLRIAAVVIAIVYLWTRFYTYTIAVTFDLKLGDIFKNARIFCVLGFFRNILSTVVTAFILATFLTTRKVDVVLMSTLLFSIIRFTVTFISYPVIDEYMIKAAEKEETNEQED